MKTITARFMAYRAKPKPAQPIGPVQPAEKPLYPIEGFLSPSETSLERQGRLTEAVIAGYRLSYDNHLYWMSHKNKPRHRRACLNDLGQLRFIDNQFKEIFTHTAPVWRG